MLGGMQGQMGYILIKVKMGKQWLECRIWVVTSSIDPQLTSLGQSL